MIKQPISRLISVVAKGSRPGRDGQVLIMFAAGLLLLVGMVAAAVDTGFLMAERRQVQNAADAGALAAARAKLDYLAEPGNSAAAQIESGKHYAASNAGVSEDDVDVNVSPDPHGDDYVEVTVTKEVTSFFLRALYDGYWGVSAVATASIQPTDIPYALVALECAPNGQAGIKISGSGTIDVNEGSIMSNCGIDRDGDSSIVTADGYIDAVGTINQGTNWSAGAGFREGMTPVKDPIDEMGVQPPDRNAAKDQGEYTTQADVVDAISGSSAHQTSSVRCSTSCTMPPGFYGGSVTLDVRQGGTLNLQPGIYYFGDDFTLTAQGDGLVRGDDVFMYFTDNARWVPHNGRVDIAAPDESPYDDGLDGMALWIDNGTDFRLQANNSGGFSGVIYAPRSSVTLSGGPGARGMQVIVGNLDLSGTGTFDILYEEYASFDVPGVFLVM